MAWERRATAARRLRRSGGWVTTVVGAVAVRVGIAAAGRLRQQEVRQRLLCGNGTGAAAQAEAIRSRKEAVSDTM